jgi:hypothetical protein
MALAVIVFLAGVVVAQGSANYEIPWDTVASGGEEMASTNWVLVGTAGQALVGGSTSSSHELEAGFWYGMGPDQGYSIYLPLVLKSNP